MQMIKLIYIIIGLSWRLSTKESACNALDADLIPGWERSLEAGHGNPLQYSCLEKPMIEEPGGGAVGGGFTSDTGGSTSGWLY